MVAKHHYVPKFYLKGFVDPSSPSHLWVADLEKMVVRKQSPNKAARISGYYDLQSSDFGDKSILENFLSVFETRASGIIHTLRNLQFK